MTGTTPQILGRTRAGDVVLAGPGAAVIGGRGTGKTVPTPHVPADQRWFWTPAWLAGEREASAEIAALFADPTD